MFFKKIVPQKIIIIIKKPILKKKDLLSRIFRFRDCIFMFQKKKNNGI